MFWQHFKTVTQHKYLVAKGCFKVGLIKQGLLHDMSKFSITEFRVGAKYYQGTRSPNNAEREDLGCSYAWMHHKGRNKHHYEYWLDYSGDADKRGQTVPVPMPNKYIAEMVMDRIAASKVYLGDKYNDSEPLKYFSHSKGDKMIHPETAQKLESVLTILAEKGEKEAFQYVRTELLNKKK